MTPLRLQLIEDMSLAGVQSNQVSVSASRRINS
jgi:hypothetical protein